MNLFAQGDAAARKTGMRNENMRRQLTLFAVGGQRNHRNSRAVFVRRVVANNDSRTDSILHVCVVAGLRQVDKLQFQSGAADPSGGHGFLRVQILDVVHLLALLIKIFLVDCKMKLDT